MAAGFEDSTLVLWSLNGCENYGRKPFQSFDDHLCQWSINNCNRTLTDDLSDYDSEEDVVMNLMDDLKEEETDEPLLSRNNSHQAQSRTTQFKVGNKYKRSAGIKELWSDFAAKSCSENNL